MEFIIKTSYIVLLFVNSVLHIFYVSKIYSEHMYIYSVHIWISEEPVVEHLAAHHQTDPRAINPFQNKLLLREALSTV